MPSELDQAGTADRDAPQFRGESKARRRLWTAARWLLSLGLLAWLLTQIDLWQAWEVLRGVRLGWLAAMVVVMAVGRFVAGYRWFVLLRPIDPTVGLGDVLRIHFMSGFLGQFLPGIVGMEAIRVVALGRLHNNLAQSFASVMLDRILGLVSLVALALIALPLAPTRLPESIRVTALLTLLVLFGVVWMILSQRVRATVERLIPARHQPRFVERTQKIYRCVDQYRSRPGLLTWGFLLAMVFQVSRVLAQMFAAIALGVSLQQVPAGYYFVFVPIILFLIMLPVSIGGLGVREMSYVGLFGLAGMSEEQAFTLAVLTMLLTRLMSLPGLYFVLRARRERSGVEPTQGEGATVPLDPAGSRVRATTTDACESSGT